MHDDVEILYNNADKEYVDVGMYSCVSVVHCSFELHEDCLWIPHNVATQVYMVPRDNCSCHQLTNVLAATCQVFGDCVQQSVTLQLMKICDQHNDGYNILARQRHDLDNKMLFAYPAGSISTLIKVT